MPVRHRNPDGSLSYTQTADENLQNQTQQSLKQTTRFVKKLSDRVDALESLCNRLKEKIDELTQAQEKS